MVMESEIKVLLEQNDFDVDGTMRRFLNNEALYIKCMKKFLDDQSYQKLKNAYEAGNCQDAFAAAHTMKGFVSNLGINSIYNVLKPMVEKLRAGDMQIGEEMQILDELYIKVCEIIKGL